MKVLMFAPAFAPFMGSESLTASKLVIALRGCGWEVDVISRHGHELYSNQWGPPWIELQPNTYSIITPSQRSFQKYLSRFTDAWTYNYPLPGVRWAAMAFQLGKQLHSKKQYDAIFSRSPSDIGHLPALRMSQEYRLNWIANWNDPPMGSWPAAYASDNGSWLTRQLHRPYIRKVLTSASMNIFPSVELKQHIQRFFRVPLEYKSRIIPHAALAATSAGATSSIRFTMTHAGKLTGPRTPHTLFEALRRFVNIRKLHPSEFSFRLIGHTDSELTTLAEAYGLSPYIEIRSAEDFVTTLDLLRESTVNVLVEAPCEIGVFLPGKLVDYASSDRPILSLSPKKGAVSRLLTEFGGGVCADVTSIDSVYHGLCLLYDDWRKGVLELKYSQRHLAGLFSPETISHAYAEAVASAKNLS